MLYEISDKIKVVISSEGAELQSIKDENSVERLWQGDAKYWGKKAPLLFPMVRGFVEETTIFDGVSYNMKNHGFVRDHEFTLVSKTDDTLIMSLGHNEDTLSRYPFEFEFIIKFTVVGSKLFQEATIKNLNDKVMPFAFGGHMGFNCPLEDGETFEDYKINFIKTGETKESYLKPEDRKNTIEEKDFTLNYDVFKNDVLIYETLTSDAVTLISSKSKKGIKVSYEGCNLIGLWTPPSINSPFICLEPWSGAANSSVTTPIEFTENIGINLLEAGGTSVKSIDIEVI